MIKYEYLEGEVDFLSRAGTELFYTGLPDRYWQMQNEQRNNAISLPLPSSCNP